MPSLYWQIPNLCIPAQSFLLNSRLIYLTLLNISTCIVYSLKLYTFRAEFLNWIAPPIARGSFQFLGWKAQVIFLLLCLSYPTSSSSASPDGIPSEYRQIVLCLTSHPSLLPPPWPLPPFSWIIRPSVLAPLSPAVCFQPSRQRLLGHKLNNSSVVKHLDA